MFIRSSFALAAVRRTKFAFALRRPASAAPLFCFLLLLFVAVPDAQGAGATIAVSPTSGDPGTALTVTGAGWPASDTVQVEIAGAPVCQVLSDPTGALLSSPANGCQVPSGTAHGSQPLTAQDTSATTQASGADFTVTPIASFTPPSSSPAVGTPVS